VTAAGGAGWQLAEWIVEGEPGIDMLAVDPRRFGGYAGKRYTVKKNEETYRNVFTVHYPDEEREDARPAKTSAIYEKLNQMGAVWGQRYGWERANWFAPTVSSARTSGASGAATISSTSATNAGCSAAASA
jgi:dimethylglycine dehydrogenase